MCKPIQCRGAVGCDLSDSNNGLTPVNQVDTAFEYVVIFVYWVIFRVSQQHRDHNYYMIMPLNIVIDHLLTTSDA